MPVAFLFLAQQTGTAPTVIIEQSFDWAGLLVGALALAGASLGAYWASRDSAKDRRALQAHELARQYAEALATALAWAETPYRIARRTSDDPATLERHALHLHDLQERILFHQQWLNVESPGIAELYRQLVGAVKAIAQQQLKDAWDRPSVTAAGQMNLGGIYPGEVSQECENFVAAVRRKLELK
jgi:hypothetical protein